MKVLRGVSRAEPPEKVSRDMGYRSTSIAISREYGPTRTIVEEAKTIEEKTNLVRL